MLIKKCEYSINCLKRDLMYENKSSASNNTLYNDMKDYSVVYFPRVVYETKCIINNQIFEK